MYPNFASLHSELHEICRICSGCIYLGCAGVNHTSSQRLRWKTMQKKNCGKFHHHSGACPGFKNVVLLSCGESDVAHHGSEITSQAGGGGLRLLSWSTGAPGIRAENRKQQNSHSDCGNVESSQFESLLQHLLLAFLVLDQRRHLMMSPCSSHFVD